MDSSNKLYVFSEKIRHFNILNNNLLVDPDGLISFCKSEKIDAVSDFSEQQKKKMTEMYFRNDAQLLLLFCDFLKN